MVVRSVVWFRRDLRVVDHPALGEACAAGGVLPLFVRDPTFARAGPPRRAYLEHSLAALRDATDGALVIRAGDPVDVVAALAAEIDATTVFVSKDFSPYGRRRDAGVAEALHAAGRRLRGVGSPYAVEPGSVTKGDGTPYAVFTPFSRRWRETGWGAPQPAPAGPDWITTVSDPMPAPPVPSAADVMFDDPHERWAAFSADGLAGYRDRRDVPAIDGTSRLSAGLKFGLIHPRQLLASCDPSDAHHVTFASELAWRDFYADVLFREPRTAWENLDRRFDRLPVDTDSAAVARFERWCAGLTGFPIVDAGMRQLRDVGWMHNRVRMIAASFLVKDLHLPWQWGARHFMRRLVDGDLASNNHGWQWTAGCGTDAAPYFRVFNPALQQERYDPDSEYVHRWIPELGTSLYPAPMIDHKAERHEALARYEAVRRG